MHISLIKQQIFPNIPSGSIIEHIYGAFWIVGDDCTTLFMLDKEGNLIKERQIFVSQYEGRRITKKEKPDFEAGTICEIAGEKYFLVLGSGSKSPERDKGFLIPLEEKEVIRSIDLGSFYDLLRKDRQIKELNIEAAATIENQVVLFNRGGNFQENLLIFPEKNIWENTIPTYTSKSISIPSIDTIPAGISGATFDATTGHLWICASAEDTQNAYDDGKITGSLIGIIYDFSSKMHLASLTLDDFIIWKEEPILKIESLCISANLGNQQYEITTVADNDDGSSILTHFHIHF